MRSNGPAAAKFTIVVARVAVDAEDARADKPGGGGAVLIQHVCQQAGLWKGTAAIVSDRMAGSGVEAELRNEVQRVTGKDEPRRQVAILDQNLLANAGAMAAEAGFILIDGGRKNSDAVDTADAGDAILGRTNRGRRGEKSERAAAVGVVAINAGGMTVVVEDSGLRGVVAIGAGGQEVRDFCKLGVNIWGHWRNIAGAAVAGDAILRAGIDAGSGGRRRTLQPRGAARVVLHVARGACVGCDGRIRADVCGAGDLVCGNGVNAGAPASKRIDLARDDTIGVMAGEAHLSVGAVAHQEVLRDSVDALDVSVVATGALDVACDEFNSLRGIRGDSLSGEGGCEVWRIFDRQDQAERMRAAEIRAEDIQIVQAAADGNLSVGSGLADGDSAVMTT